MNNNPEQSEHFEDVHTDRTILDICVPLTITKKLEAIENLQAGMAERALQHKNRFNMYKRVDDIKTVITTVLSMVAVSGLTTHFIIQNNNTAIVLSTACVSISFVINVTAVFAKLSERISDEFLLARQYKNLKQEMDIRILQNHITSEQLFAMIKEVDARMHLIEDSETLL